LRESDRRFKLLYVSSILFECSRQCDPSQVHSPFRSLLQPYRRGMAALTVVHSPDPREAEHGRNNQVHHAAPAHDSLFRTLGHWPVNDFWSPDPAVALAAAQSQFEIMASLARGRSDHVAVLIGVFCEQLCHGAHGPWGEASTEVRR
jgi:hypothetical protein